MSLLSRPIVFTADLPAWRRILDGLGGRAIVDLPGWVVYALGSGRVALHDAEHSEHEPGHVLLGFETPHLQAWSVSTPAEHVLEDTDHGRAATLRQGDGVWFWVDTMAEPDAGPGSDPAVSVLALWYTTQTTTARQTLTDVGALPRITGRDGRWADMTCPGGGLVAVHAPDTSGPGAPADAAEVAIAFEYDGDVEGLRARLVDAGVDAVVVDESYSRVLQVPDPDGRAPIWVNQAQTDLYGYTREDA